MDSEIPCTVVQVTKEQAGQLGIGQEVSFVVSGEVKSIQENENSYSVEMKHTSVAIDEKAQTDAGVPSKIKEVTGHDMGPADYELERMLG